jgi:hypothetical protein
MRSKNEIADLRDKASIYRALARQTLHDEAAHGIFALAAQLEQRARDLKSGEPSQLAAANSTSIHNP